MIRKDVPNWFSNSIKRYDPNLRVRWSYEKGRFAIDEKTNRHFIPRPVRYVKNGYVDDLKEVVEPEYSERYIQYHDGYSTILYCGTCSEAVLQQIREMDLARSHRKKKIREEADAISDKIEKSEEKKFSNDMEAISGEAFDTIKRKTGDTISMISDKCSDSNWY